MPINDLFVRVEFKGNRREIFLNSEQSEFQPGDYVLVETDSGVDLGAVRTRGCGNGDCPNKPGALTEAPSPGPAFQPRQASGNGPARNHHGSKTEPNGSPGNGYVNPDAGGQTTEKTVKRILRPASHAEINRLMENRKAEDQAWGQCLRFVEQHQLVLKLVDVEYQFDRKKITFYYTADERVDFRQLVKDLAGVFRTRIEMRQIGARDQARRVGGVGSCGQELCCTRFLEGFVPINTQYAKDQNLPINPSKLGGACGKLKCCLRYEWDFYFESIKDFPTVGIPVELPNGVATIIGNDILSRRVNLVLENGTMETLELNRVKKILIEMAEDSRRKQH